MGQSTILPVNASDSNLGDDTGLNIDDANEAFEEMQNEFKSQKDNYGNITIWDGDEIYDSYQQGIRNAVEALNVEGKLKKFEQHEFNGYGTVKDVDKKISQTVENETEWMENKFDKEVDDAESFLSRFIKQQDKVGEYQESTAAASALASAGNKEKYMSMLSNYKQGLSNMSFDELGCYAKGLNGITSQVQQPNMNAYIENIENLKAEKGLFTLPSLHTIPESIAGIVKSASNEYNETAATVYDSCNNPIGVVNQSATKTPTEKSEASSKYAGVTANAARDTLNTYSDAVLNSSSKKQLTQYQTRYNAAKARLK